MSFTLFIHVETSDNSRVLPLEAVERVRSILRNVPGLKRALIHRPTTARDYYTDDGASPRLALQLYFDRLEWLEAAVGPHGALQALASPFLWATLPDRRITHQVMYARPYPVLDAGYRPDGDEPPCSYLVHYPGAAEDFNRWLDYYLDHHPQIMKNFPRIRGIEIYTRVGWRDSLPWQRVDYMQRNRLIFDSAGALEAALHSPVRHDMRADFEKFPPFTGSNVHYPVHTEFLALQARGAAP